MQKLLEGTCAAPVKVDRQWDFAYDGDGTRVKQVLSAFDPDTQAITGTSVTSYFAGGLYEETLWRGQADGAARKYCAISGITVAMSDAAGVTCDSCRRYLRWPLEAASQRKYLPTDHLGSVNAVTLWRGQADDAGTLLDQQRYEARPSSGARGRFGGVRESVGSITQTDYGYTGQRGLAGMGLMDYKARAYDPLLGRFIQPDTFIPNPADPQSWNRFTYVRNSPLLFTDPTGNFLVEGDDCTSLSCSGDPDHKFTQKPLDKDKPPETGTPSDGTSRAEAAFTVPLAPTTFPNTSVPPLIDNILAELFSIVPGLPQGVHLPLFVYDFYFENLVSPSFGNGPITLKPGAIGIGPAQFSADGYVSMASGSWSFAGDRFQSSANYSYGAKLSAETTGAEITWRGASRIRGAGGLTSFVQETSIRTEYHPTRALLVGAVAVGVTLVVAEPWTAPAVYAGCKTAGVCP